MPEEHTKPIINQALTSTYWRCYDLRTGQIYWEIVAQHTQLWSDSWSMTTALAPNTIEYASPTQSEVSGAEAAGAWSVALMYLQTLT